MMENDVSPRSLNSSHHYNGQKIRVTPLLSKKAQLSRSFNPKSPH